MSGTAMSSDSSKMKEVYITYSLIFTFAIFYQYPCTKVTLRLAQTLKDFKTKMQKILGLKISDRETLELFKKYGQRDFENAVSRKVSMVRKKYEQRIRTDKVHHSSVDCSNYSLEQLFDTINERISSKTGSSLGDYRMRKAYELFSAGQKVTNDGNSILTREQMRSILQLKLNLLVPESLVEKIFEAMDPLKTGIVKTRNFVTAVVNSSHLGTEPSLRIEGDQSEATERGMQSSEERKPFATYDSKFLNLAPPPKANSLHEREPYTVADIENAICEQIVQRTGKGTTLVQTLVKCFGDSRNDKEIKNVGITRDQVRFSLWTRFQMNVTDDEINLLFAKYDVKKTGLLPLHPFVEGVIKNHAMSKALMAEAEVEGSYADDPLHRLENDAIDDLLHIIKQAIVQIVNREARPPHYILHSLSRMRLDQFKSFITHKLRVPSQDVNLVMKLAVKHYLRDTLVDARKMLYDAMAFNKASKPNGEGEKKSNTMIEAHELPSTLRSIRYTPEKIEEILVTKIGERAKNNNPLSTLHKLFKCGEKSTKTINRESLSQVFKRFDILTSRDDFENFYKHHDRGDGLIDIRHFLLRLIPQPDHSINPLAPKPSAEVKRQMSLAAQLASVTGRKREVPSINGVTNNRFEAIDSNGTEINHPCSERPPSAYDVHGNKTEGFEYQKISTPVPDFFESLKLTVASADSYANVPDARPYSTPTGSDSGIYAAGNHCELSTQSREKSVISPRPPSAPSTQSRTQTTSSPTAPPGRPITAPSPRRSKNVQSSSGHHQHKVNEGIVDISYHGFIDTWVTNVS